MPLFVGDELIEKEYKSSTELFDRYPELKEKSHEFASQPTIEFPKDEKVLYIGQREYGTVHPSDSSLTIIGSDSATTCHLVVLRNPGTGACSLAHFDGHNMLKALQEMMKSLSEFSDRKDKNRIELHVVGGFLDDRGISEDMFLTILNGAAQLSEPVELVCACSCALNDQMFNGHHTPKIYGIGVFISSGKIVPVQQFQCVIPDENLRHVANYANDQIVQHVYSSRTQELTVTPFQLISSADVTRQQAALPDEMLLKYFSTSPHCEPPNFVPSMRAAFRFLSENPNIMKKFFPDGKPRRFKRENNGEWRLIDQD